MTDPTMIEVYRVALMGDRAAAKTLANALLDDLEALGMPPKVVDSMRRLMLGGTEQDRRAVIPESYLRVLEPMKETKP